MIKWIISLLMIASLMYGYVDSDLDGVDDSVDKCPNTPFSDLVDESGCTIESLVKKDTNSTKPTKRASKKRRYHKKRVSKRVSKRETTYIEPPKRKTHYDISIGFNKYGTISSETVMANIYYGNYSLSLFSAIDNKRDYDDSRVNDTRIWGYYTHKYSKNLLLKVGAGIVKPKLDGDYNSRLDAGLSLFGSYSIGGFSPFLGATYKFNGLKGDEEGLSNNYSIYGGAGFYINSKLYMSYSYSYSSSEYDWADDIKTDSIYLYYNIDNNWFSSASYMRNIDGLDYDDGFSLSIGYYF